MSDIVLKLIPKQVGYIPKNFDKQLLLIFLKEVGLYYNEVEVVVTENIEYVDCGSNMITVTCNVCNSNASQWWGDQMTKGYSTNFEEREFITPCCNSKMKLEDLNYNFHSGFSRFTIEIRNPNFILSDKQVKNISKIVKCTLEKIVAHY